MNTFLAAAAAGLAWAVVERIRDGQCHQPGCRIGHRRRPRGDHPGAGFVGGDVADWIGLVAGVICCFAVGIKTRRATTTHSTWSACTSSAVSSVRSLHRLLRRSRSIFGGDHGGPVLRRRTELLVEQALRQRRDHRLLVHRDACHHAWSSRPRSASGSTRTPRTKASTSPSTPRPSYNYCELSWTERLIDDVKLITAVIKPFKLDDVQGRRLKAPGRRRHDRDPRCRASAAGRAHRGVPGAEYTMIVRAEGQARGRV